jgi:mRNA-degrading endonuclease RelE of RelBE toxin-antitoxin system
MSVSIELTDNFIRQAKVLLKKYRSLPQDLEQLQKDLIDNPKLGVSLGNGAFKIRLRIKSKGRGKSGGARVISFTNNNIITISNQDDSGKIIVYLLSIYDKSETETISNQELIELIKLVQ